MADGPHRKPVADHGHAALGTGAMLIEIADNEPRVLWHPDGARSGVIMGPSPAENPAGQFRFPPQKSAE